MKGKHALIMLLCCLIPLLGMGIAWALGVPLGTLGTVLILLICPLGHIFLMRKMGHEGHHSNTAGNSTTNREQAK